jgi:hypothetical protein
MRGTPRDVLLQMLGYLRVAFLSPLLGYGRGDPQSSCSLSGMCGEDSPQIRPEILAPCTDPPTLSRLRPS